MPRENLRLCPLAMIADSINSNWQTLEDRMGCMYLDCAWYVKTYDACAVTLLSRAAAHTGRFPPMKKADCQKAGEWHD